MTALANGKSSPWPSLAMIMLYFRKFVLLDLVERLSNRMWNWRARAVQRLLFGVDGRRKSRRVNTDGRN